MTQPIVEAEPPHAEQRSNQAEPPPAVRLEHVVKRFGDVTAVAGVDLEIRKGEFFSLLGPSGSGKTSCLRMIAGFEYPTEGRVWLDGEDVTDLPPNERDVNTVFQDYALFPHMTVGENVEYGLRVRKVPRERTPRRGGRGAADGPARGVPGSQDRASSPAGSASAWRSPARWSTARRSCCSTSRSARST